MSAFNPAYVLVLLALSCPNAWGSTHGSAPLSAEESDPQALQWMTGFPPPDDKLIAHPQSNYFSFPKLRWTVCHIRELLPTTRISRGIGAPDPLPYALDNGINDISFMPMGSDTQMNWRESLAANYTDGLLILHKGKIVYEYYNGCLSETGKHAAMSMTKSLTGLLAEVLVAEGKLDDEATVDSLVPELKNSAFGSATVRQVMDMTTALDYSEDYADPEADIWQYSAAASPLPKPSDYSGPEGYFEYLQTVEQNGDHGDAFGYRTVNSDALGWIIARVSGKSVANLLSERLWNPLGTEQDAYMTIDAKGTPFAGGGLSAGLRDLGRIGLLMLNKGKYKNRQLFPESVVNAIQAGGDKKAFAKAGYTTLPGASYRSMWWIFNNANGAYAARGVHGQRSRRHEAEAVRREARLGAAL